MEDDLQTIDLSGLGEEFDEEEKNKKTKDEILAGCHEIEERIEMAKEANMYYGFINVKTGKRR